MWNYAKHFAKYSVLFILLIFAAPYMISFISGYVGGALLIPVATAKHSIFPVVAILCSVLFLGILFFQQAKLAPKYSWIFSLATIAFLLVMGYVKVTLRNESFSMEHLWKMAIYISIILAATLLGTLARKQTNISENTSNHYFSVSMFKFFFLSIVTMGLYKVYWWYKNWQFVKHRDQNKSWPKMRAIFPVFFYHLFIRDVNNAAEREGVLGIKHGKLLITAYISTVVITGLISAYTPPDASLASLKYGVQQILYVLLTALLITPIIQATDRLNQKTHPTLPRNRSITWKNLVFIMLGMLLWLPAMGDLSMNFRDKKEMALTALEYHGYKKAYRIAQSANPNDKNIQYLLGRMLFEGIGVKKDTAAGLQWLEKSAAQNNPEAQFYLARINQTDKVIATPNYSQSVQQYEKLAQQGDIYAMNNLAIMYMDGKGVAKNPEKALALFQQAAAKGDTMAMYNVGLYYKDTETIPNHFTLAAAWFAKVLASKPSSATSCAANDLGILYATGKGVPQDPAKAKKLFGDAIDAMYFYDNENAFQMNKRDTRMPSIRQAFIDYQWIKKGSGKDSNPVWTARYQAKEISTTLMAVQKLEQLCWA